MNWLVLSGPDPPSSLPCLRILSVNSKNIKFRESLTLRTIVVEKMFWNATIFSLLRYLNIQIYSPILSGWHFAHWSPRTTNSFFQVADDRYCVEVCPKISSRLWHNKECDFVLFKLREMSAKTLICKNIKVNITNFWMKMST